MKTIFILLLCLISFFGMSQKLDTVYHTDSVFYYQDYEKNTPTKQVYDFNIRFYTVGDSTYMATTKTVFVLKRFLGEKYMDGMSTMGWSIRNKKNGEEFIMILFQDSVTQELFSVVLMTATKNMLVIKIKQNL